MKKLIFSFSFLLALNVLSAQKMGIGIRASASFMKQKFPSELESSFSTFGGLKNITSINVAIPIEISLSDMFSLQPEVNFIQKGFKISSNILGLAQIDASQIINYFEVPILAKVDFLKESPLGVSVFAGPSFGFALSGTQNNNISGTGIPAVNQNDPIDFEDFNRFEVGLHGGINLKYRQRQTVF